MNAKHFDLEELVDRDTFGTYGEDAWKLLHPDAIIALDGVREYFGVPVTVNNWKWGGPFQYRGYRPPHCGIGAPQSYHKRGMAFDFDVRGLDALTVRKVIKDNQSDPLLEKIMRLEDVVSWVHMDVGRIPDGKHRIYLFKG